MTADKMTRRRLIAGTGAAGCVMAAPAILHAETTWPSRPIKFVIPFSPGGSTDILARIIAQKIEPVLEQSIVIDNKPGAGGVLAASAVAHAEPDGHTFMMGHIGTLAFNPSLYPKLPYDPFTAFAAVARVATVPNILAIHPSIPATSPAEFIAYARANPGKLNFGSGGNGSAAHIATAYFAHLAGLDIVHVPFRGTAPAVNDLISNHIQMIMTGGPALLPMAAGGLLRALAVSSKERAPFAPTLPTLSESVLPGFDAVQWYGLVAPSNTPRNIVDRMNTLINAQLANTEVLAHLQRDGAIAAPGTPQAFDKQIGEEIEIWRKVIQTAHITIAQ